MARKLKDGEQGRDGRQGPVVVVIRSKALSMIAAAAVVVARGG